MFSDESHFELRYGNQKTRCRRPIGLDRFAPEFTMKTVRNPQVTVWGSFSGGSEECWSSSRKEK
jgi:hypothetical protein